MDLFKFVIWLISVQVLNTWKKLRISATRMIHQQVTDLIHQKLPKGSKAAVKVLASLNELQ